MASVGGQACTFLKGEAPSQKMRTRIWQIPGIHGYGAQLLGLGDSQFEFTAVLLSTAAGVATWVGLIEAMQGTIVSVITDWGNTYSNCLITEISQPQVTTAVGYGITARGELKIKGVII